MIQARQHSGRDNEAARRRAGFSLIELLVVIGIIALLSGLIVPYLLKAKHLAGEKVCASNMRSANMAMRLYGEEYGERYPLEATEHNPHPALVRTLEKYNSGIVDAMYCPQASYLETFAGDPNYTPKGDTDSVIDTPANRAAGRISYVYWSFEANKLKPGGDPSQKKDYWRNFTYFLPRQLNFEGPRFAPGFIAAVEARPPGDPQRMQYEACRSGPAQETWVISDFFRQGAPFPHAREHARGLNVGYLDGHVDLLFGRPRDSYR